MQTFSDEFKELLNKMSDRDENKVAGALLTSTNELNTKRMSYIMINTEDNSKLNFMKPTVPLLNEDGTFNEKGMNSGKVIRVLRTLLENVQEDYELSDRDYELFLQEYKRETIFNIQDEDFMLYSNNMIDEGYAQDNYEGFEDYGDVERDREICVRCGELREEHENECTCYSNPMKEVSTRYMETTSECITSTMRFDRDVFYEDDFDCDSVGYTLGSSCMRYYRCVYDNYFQIYKDNAKLLVLLNEKGQIRARAVIWDTVQVYATGKQIGTFMDRVYAVDNEAEDDMIAYAKKHRWAYKADQSAHSKKSYYLFDTVTKNYIRYCETLIIPISSPEYNRAPYMDTFTYVVSSKNGFFLSNGTEKLDKYVPYIELHSTEGHINSEGLKRSCDCCGKKLYYNDLQGGEKRYFENTLFIVEPKIIYTCETCFTKKQKQNDEVLSLQTQS